MTHVRRVWTGLFMAIAGGTLSGGLSAPVAAHGPVSAVRVHNGSDHEKWLAKRQVSCIDATNIAGAIIVDNQNIDLYSRDGTRWRLRLQNSCNQPSYYGGFYYQPTTAGQICAGKDRLLGRAGGECRLMRIFELRKIRDR